MFLDEGVLGSEIDQDEIQLALGFLLELIEMVMIEMVNQYQGHQKR
jgi:hypothetical protein